MGNLYDKKNEILDRLELDSKRKEEEYKQRVINDMIPVNERVIEYIDKTDFPKFRTRQNHIKITHIFKENLDLTIQEDAERFSMKTIFNKVVNGEPLPKGAIKENGLYSVEDMPDGDLTDLYIINEHYKNKYGLDLKSVYDEAIEKAQLESETKEEEAQKIAPEPTAQSTEQITE